MCQALCYILVPYKSFVAGAIGISIVQMRKIKLLKVVQKSSHAKM